MTEKDDDIIRTFKEMEALGHGRAYIKNNEWTFKFSENTRNALLEIKRKYGITNEARLLGIRFLTSPAPKSN